MDILPQMGIGKDQTGIAIFIHKWSYEDHFQVSADINSSITMRAAEKHRFVHSEYETDRSCCFVIYMKKIRPAEDKCQNWNISHVAMWSNPQRIIAVVTTNVVALKSSSI